MAKQPGEPIEVAIIEDKRAIREGLRLLIGATDGYRCGGTYESVEEGLRGLARAPADVLLLDIHLPGMPGSEGVRVLREKHPSMQVLMLTIYDEEEKIFESICNGACGYLLKKTPPAKLLEALSDAYHGGSPMSPEVARKVVQLFQRIGPPERAAHRLTPSEVRLLGLLSMGCSYQAAAGRLSLSINTVRDHVRSIYDKLHVHSKAEAVWKAVKSGIV
ncbi:MAG: response regulator transcription factor [Acidobacteriia bacterium]|nr:response regulator transcription factor [Terriglobia bacterium]